jgi:hypothetical protein
MKKAEDLDRGLGELRRRGALLYPPGQVSGGPEIIEFQNFELEK